MNQILQRDKTNLILKSKKSFLVYSQMLSITRKKDQVLVY